MLKQLASDLTAKYGRGFSRQGLQKMRAFYLEWRICPTVSGKLQIRVKYELPATETGGQKLQTLSALSSPVPSLDPSTLLDAFPLPWSHYVRLMAVRDDFARWFYEDEAIRGGWSVRQLDRQIG